jgi:CheY-like chemotaxis protein
MSTTVQLESPAAVDANAQIKILCVDDEPHVLEGLALHLRRRYQVARATSGAAGLKLLEEDPSISVVISDMRMPAMDGAAFLSQVRQIAPDTVRLLLTGQAQIESAVAAVNEGGIFRFLTKPCPPAALMAAVDAAAAQHRLVTAERVLLEQTLQGSIKALTDVLSLTNPRLFGRASRAKHYVTEVAKELGVAERWQVEVAALLSPLGSIALPTETAERHYSGQPLSLAEKEMVARVPALTDQLLASIPRLEIVRAMLSTAENSSPELAIPWNHPQRQVILTGAAILRATLDFAALEARGHTSAVALDTLRDRPDVYDPKILDAIHVTRGLLAEGDEIQELPLSELFLGMILLEDAKGDSGVLLAARGFEVTPGFVERARNFRQNSLSVPLRVIVPRAVRHRIESERGNR